MSLIATCARIVRKGICRILELGGERLEDALGDVIQRRGDRIVAIRAAEIAA